MTVPQLTPSDLTGPVIRALRVKAGLTATELARRAQIDRSQLWRIETRNSRPYPATLARIAAALGLGDVA